LEKREKDLHRSDEAYEIYRAQGATSILNEILNLETDLRVYARNVLEGKIEPIKEE